jgi:pyridoxamine 5'-phosphate oxidase
MSLLPSPPPANPLPIIGGWLEEARRSGVRNPDAMALATVSAEGRPSVRMVLMRGLSLEQGYAVFYTHYRSRKAVDIQNRNYVAGVLYWERSGRQVRLEGPVLRSPDAESDAYFARRPFGSQLNAWVSEQSAPIADLAELERRAASKQREQHTDVLARPAWWGGYRLWFSAVELWLEGADRFHDRIRYERELTPADRYAFSAGDWRAQRLQP